MHRTNKGTGEMTDNKDALLTEWKNAQTALAVTKEKEAALRKQVFEAFSQDAKPGYSGTENIDIGFGCKLKITHKLSYSLTGDTEKLDKVLDAIENSMEGGNIIAERLVKFKPELSVSEYKLLSSANKSLIDGVLTIKDASPTIEIVYPKGSA